MSFVKDMAMIEAYKKKDEMNPYVKYGIIGAVVIGALVGVTLIIRALSGSKATSGSKTNQWDALDQEETETTTAIQTTANEITNTEDWIDTKVAPTTINTRQTQLEGLILNKKTEAANQAALIENQEDQLQVKITQAWVYAKQRDGNCKQLIALYSTVIIAPWNLIQIIPLQDGVSKIDSAVSTLKADFNPIWTIWQEQTSMYDAMLEELDLLESEYTAYDKAYLKVADTLAIDWTQSDWYGNGTGKWDTIYNARLTATEALASNTTPTTTTA